MSWQLFGSLDDDWKRFAPSTIASRALERWSDDPVLARFEDLDAIIATLRGGSADPARADQILLALVARASRDGVAARTMLQALIPGLVNVAKRLGRGEVDEELEAQVLTEAIDRIRNYPLGRRPRAVAANITWDVFGRITRQRRATSRVIPFEHAAEVDPLIPPDLDPSEEVLALIGDALATGEFRDTDARLVAAIAVGHDTIRGRAEREGVTYEAMNERWRRARNRLRDAIAVAA